MTADPAIHTDYVLVPTAEISTSRDLLCRDLVHEADGRRAIAEHWRPEDPDRRAAVVLDALTEYVQRLPVTDERLAHLALSIRGHDTAWPIVLDLDTVVAPLLTQSEINLDLVLDDLLSVHVPDHKVEDQDQDEDEIAVQLPRIVDRLLALSAEVTGTTPLTLNES